MNFSGNKAVRFLDFLLRDSYSRQIVFKSTTVNWVWPDVPSHAQPRPDLPKRVGVTYNKVVIVTLKNSSGRKIN